MGIRSFVVRVAAGLAAISALLPSVAQAQAYPARPITMIVPFPAAGPSDALARMLAHSMSAHLGKTVVVENATGAGGIVGRAKTANAEPNGYTVLLDGIGAAVSATMNRKLPYDPATAFEPVAAVATTPMVLVGRKDFPAKDITELIRYIRANKLAVTYANGGVGSGSHLCGMLLMSALQVDLTSVSYRGAAPAMLDVLAGRVDLLCDLPSTTAPPIREGMLKGYAVTTKARVATLPELPSFHQAGVTGFDFSGWYALMAPRGTPRPIVDRLAAALRLTLNDPEVKKKFAEFGSDPATEDLATPDAFAAFYRAELARWAAIVKAKGVYID